MLCFSLGITGKIAGACMIANALFNTFVLCKVRFGLKIDGWGVGNTHPMPL